ncbi:hypothetical protein QBC47DRAFT_457342 [Echria macrotheca]|uniref:Uncharacterized protein n=1 Tax=Echria macrotheca TaxID=438768 RepID=A0AAJ0BIL9_9PEZI|nr:hypothetical protein QBC47DRAFT_457342 [Echria macrotheca]
MPVITEDAYVVISPSLGFSVVTNGQERMFFKIGTHADWDASKPDYARCNPNVWYRSFRIQWTGNNNAGQGQDIYGLDGPKQILTRMFATQGAAAQAAYQRLYPNANTEWWYTDNANCIQALRNLQNGWDQQWQAGAVMPNLNPNNNIQSVASNQALPIGTVAAAQIVGGNNLTAGPVFDRRFGAVAFFRQRIGIPSTTI